MSLNSNVINKFNDPRSQGYYLVEGDNISVNSPSDALRGGNDTATKPSDTNVNEIIQNIKDTTVKDKLTMPTNKNIRGAMIGAAVGLVLAFVTKRSIIGLTAVGAIGGVIVNNILNKKVK